MEQTERNEKIAAASKLILSYCISRTSNHDDAEDLSQEILYELIRSSANLRDENAFYGFMWSIAGNVYKTWYKKRMRAKKTESLEILSEVSDETDLFEDDSSDVYLLRRELSLLSAKYRKATVLYYLYGKSCAEIADILSVSESMVKYLLFKSRNILKEGMIMERNYGTQSYDPKKLELFYMGEGPNRHYALLHEHKIRQNILWACYNDELSEQEIALQIGVSLPYIEQDIKLLTDAWLLVKKGTRYRTNLIIITEEFDREKAGVIQPIQEKIAACIRDFVTENEDSIRKIGFFGCDMSQTSLRWHMATMLLLQVWYENPLRGKLVYPMTAFGNHAFVWGVESYRSAYNTCTIDDIGGIRMCFMDWLMHPSSDHHHFWGHEKRVLLYSKIIYGNEGVLHEYEEEIAAELIKLGYLRKIGDTLTVTVPVYTKEQLARMRDLQKETIQKMVALFVELYEKNVAILKNHVPTQLKKQAEDIAVMNLFQDASFYPTYVLTQSGYLSTERVSYEMPTVYIVKE